VSLGKLLLWILGVLVAALAGLLVYLSVADLTWVKDRIETSVSDATGREFRIGGDFQLDLLPEPSVLLEDVTLANADWGSEPDMVKVGHFSARVGLWSLLSGPIEVRELRLRDVDVLLETNEEGASNTEMGEPAPEEPPADDGDASREVPVIVELAEIRNVRLRSKSPDEEATEIVLEALDINLDEQQNMGLTGNGQALGAPFHLAGTVGPAVALQRGADINVDLEGALGSLAYSARGILGDLETLNGTDLSARLSAEEVAELLKTLEVESPLSGPLAADLTIRGADDVVEAVTEASAGAIAVTATTRLAENTVDFDATIPALDKAGAALEIEGLPAADLVVKGRVVDTGDGSRLEGVVARVGEALVNLDGTIPRDPEETARFDVKAQAPNLQTLREDLPALPLSALLSAALTPGAADLDLTEVSLGRTDLSGTASIRTGERTSVTARLQSNIVDLGELRGDGKEQAEEKEKSDSGEDDTPQEYVFTEEPLPFEQLQTTDLDIDYRIGALVSHPRKYVDMHTTVNLEGGMLVFRNRFQGDLGGKYASDIDLNAARAPADMKIIVNMRDLKLNVSSGEDATPEQIPATDITLDITSTGGSARAIASNLNGRMLLTQGPGRIENKLVGAVTGDIFAQLFSALNPLAKDEEYSNWDCSIFSLDITSGEADINGFLLQGEKLMIVGGGDIDFNTEELNIEFNTKPREGVGISASSIVSPFVKLKGTFASPSIALDKKGAILSGGAAVATGGLSLLVQSMAGRATAEGDQCEPTLAEVGGHPPIQE
jgi:uncharacterized protein involved in outer membrane biogenesis